VPSSKPTLGVNDLQSQYPDVAVEAYGWDPETITTKSHQKKDWKCKEGHIYSSAVSSRTNGRGCPFCSGNQVLAGFNDLLTKFPAIAAEAFGWDPSAVVAGTHQKKEWKCSFGHIYISSVSHRAEGTSCSICSNTQILVGFNDLQSRFPEIAKQAYGWNPLTVFAFSNKKRHWRCDYGHIWETVVSKRTTGRGCPICANRVLLVGFNDLKTKFPSIADQADGWDPSLTITGSSKRKGWKCKYGHNWEALVSNRCFSNTGCPVCNNLRVLIGFNDLKTKYPKIAQEADGWDPSGVVYGTPKMMKWKCSYGHKWSATIDNRTRKDSGCPACAEYGFNTAKDAWFYLMERPGEQQLGITNDFSTRMKRHEKNGWSLIEHTTVPSKGQKVLDTETAFKKWLKKEVGLMEGTTENWSTTKMEVQSLAELKEMSGIETDLF